MLRIWVYSRLPDSGSASRGVERLEQVINAIAGASYDSLPTLNAEALAKQALEVDPNRMSLPEQAGPPDFLAESQTQEFLTMPQWVPKEGPIPELKACHKVSPKNELQVVKKLLDSGMATLIPASDAVHDSAGKVVSGGLFAVPHKAASDRIINDRRPFNIGENRLDWSRLPHGSLLTQLVLPPDHSIRASGDDLSNYFYLIKHLPEWLPRNTVGRPWDGSHFQEYGCVPGLQYMVAFNVVCMGDTNAVDIAQQTHIGILRQASCLKSQHLLEYGKVVPASHTLEGLYIDDHLVLQILPSRRLHKGMSFEDEAIVARSRQQYADLSLPVSAKKAFTYEHDFIAWGTQVSSRSGRVGCPLSKLKQIEAAICEVVKLPHVTKRILQQVVGLCVHPAMHRREVMCLFECIFKVIAESPEGKFFKLPVPCKEELLSMALMFPALRGNIKWRISPRISATDASSEGGGRAATFTTNAVATALYRHAVHRGEHVRLDWASGGLAPTSDMRQATEDLEALMLSHAWTTTQVKRFRRRSHINLQELEMLRSELKHAANRFTEGLRLVNLCDSRVCVGAWAKGRSSSKHINRVRKRCLGWAIAGQKCLCNVWVGTAANPSDYPSRFKPIPPPGPWAPHFQKELGVQVTAQLQRCWPDKAMRHAVLTGTSLVEADAL